MKNMGSIQERRRRNVSAGALVYDSMACGSCSDWVRLEHSMPEAPKHEAPVRQEEKSEPPEKFDVLRAF